MKASCCAALAIAVLVYTPARAEPPPVKVMILGTYHFDNPGLDTHNLKADDVTTPRRQAELAELAVRIKRFKPTRVAVESAVDAADLKLAAYRAYVPADLATTRNERAQIGFRIAHDAGLADVYGIDEQSHTIDYYPYDKVKVYAEHGGAAARARPAALNQQVEAMLGEFTAAQKTQSAIALLASCNKPARIRTMHEFYYDMLALGDAKTRPRRGAQCSLVSAQRQDLREADADRQAGRSGDRRIRGRALVLVTFFRGVHAWLSADRTRSLSDGQKRVVA